jgi:hypothetical protein
VINLYPLLGLSSCWKWVPTPRLAPWQTPTAGAAAESGSTERQQRGYPTLSREAMRVILPERQ